MFRSARLKLTLWYLLILIFISIAFSLVIYEGLSNEVDRFTRMQRTRIELRLYQGELSPFPAPQIMDPDLVVETKGRIIIILIIINGVIVFIAGGLSYFLAGKTLQPIKDMVEEQNRFITDASHELRTPLTSLKSSLEVYLRDKNLTLQDARKVISESIDDVNKLQSLSDELLQLSQYQKPDTYSKFESLSLSQIINQALQKIKPIAQQKQIAVKSEIEDVEINGNKYGLIDLFVILLDNAVKYSRRKSTVTIVSEKTDSLISIRVQDQGIGIEEKEISHIFDRFFRGDNARLKTSVTGYGLGLAIAKRIVDIHRGTITVKSKKNKGTVFTVHLPYRFS